MRLQESPLFFPYPGQRLKALLGVGTPARIGSISSILILDIWVSSSQELNTCFVFRRSCSRSKAAEWTGCGNRICKLLALKDTILGYLHPKAPKARQFQRCNRRRDKRYS